MAKKSKGLVKKNIDKIGDRVSEELHRATEQIQTVVNDFYQQAEGIQKQISDPVKKLIKDIEDVRDKELKRVQDEYQRVIGEIGTLQAQVLEKLGLADKLGATSRSGKKNAAPAKKAVRKATSVSKAKPRKKSPEKKPVQTGSDGKSD